MRPHWPVGPSTSLAARCRQTLLKARGTPSRPRTTTMLSPMKLEGVEIAGPGNIVQMADQLPGRGEDPFLLGGKEAGVGIDPARQAEASSGSAGVLSAIDGFQVSVPAGPGQSR